MPSFGWETRGLEGYTRSLCQRPTCSHYYPSVPRRHEGLHVGMENKQDGWQAASVFRLPNYLGDASPNHHQLRTPLNLACFSLRLSLTVPQACGLFIPGEQEKLILTNHIFFFPYCLDQNLKSEIQENKILLTQRPPLSPSYDFVLSGEHWLLSLKFLWWLSKVIAIDLFAFYLHLFHNRCHLGNKPEMPQLPGCKQKCKGMCGKCIPGLIFHIIQTQM